jgi:hypothetical protein
VVEERSAVQRDGLEVKVLWRERGSFPISDNGKGIEQIVRGQ